MRLKAVSGMMLTLLSIGMLTLAFNIQPVKAGSTTWIVDDDGPADFSSIQGAINAASLGDTIYVKAGTYSEPQVTITKPLQLVGENKNTTIIDGGGTWVCFYVQSTNNVNITGFKVQNGYGIYSYRSENVTISGNIISNNGQGIIIFESTNNTVSKNILTLNGNPIFLSSSNGNRILENIVTLNSGDAIWLDNSHGNIIRGNNVSYNGLGTPPGHHHWGIRLDFSSSNNIIYHNNIIDNYEQATIWMAGNNTWDNGYPSGGNYWSDYTGVDVKSGPNQDQPSSDGIGDTPYVIDANNTDYYPLMYPWGAPPPPSYTLTVHSSPSGVTFTVDGVPRTAPWSGTYTENASVSLVMPETHDGYEWNYWSDTDTNRTKTATMNTNIALTGVFAPILTCVGCVSGKATPINTPIHKPELQIPWIWLSTIVLSLVLTVVYVKKRKRNKVNS